MRVRHLLLFALASLGCCMTLWVQAASSVLVVSSGVAGVYTEVAESLTDEVERGGLARREVQLVSVDQLNRGDLGTPRLYVALGVEATDALAKMGARVPVLSTLLPRSSFERVLQAQGRRASAQFSAVFLDQPMSRQLDLIQLAWPGVRRIGILWGAESQALAPAWRAVALQKGLKLVEATVSGPSSFTPLTRILDEAEVLLAIADPQVYNSTSIQNILLASFRAKVPMVAFSPAYVRAGAVLALHATPAQLGQQAGAVVRGFLQGKGLPPEPVNAQLFSVTVNEHVARSLGLSLEADPLSAQLRRREGSP